MSDEPQARDGTPVAQIIDVRPGIVDALVHEHRVVQGLECRKTAPVGEVRAAVAAVVAVAAVAVAVGTKVVHMDLVAGDR